MSMYSEDMFGDCYWLTRAYCNSFQELDLSAEAYIVLDGSKEEEWTRAISESLGSGYQKVVSKQLIGLLIVMFASTEHAEYVKEVSTQSAGCGIMGVLVRMNFQSTSFFYGPSYWLFLGTAWLGMVIGQ